MEFPQQRARIGLWSHTAERHVHIDLVADAPGDDRGMVVILANQLDHLLARVGDQFG